ncbi:Aklanonic acid methyltransferase [Fusarium sp. NRRL 52700]|nr:Aklanonic acid methyltransferase [Fusarium sp. NRRL 52700]
MAHAKAQGELQKRYEEGSQSLEDSEVEHRITQADKMMRKPALFLTMGVAQRVWRDQCINVDATVLDAQDSGLPRNSFSHLTMNFAMHIIPDPAAVLRDTIRILRPGGLVAFSVPHANNGHDG